MRGGMSNYPKVGDRIVVIARISSKGREGVVVLVKPQLNLCGVVLDGDADDDICHFDFREIRVLA
jgi:hypothetical protein